MLVYRQKMDLKILKFVHQQRVINMVTLQRYFLILMPMEILGKILPYLYRQALDTWLSFKMVYHQNIMIY